VGVNFPGNAGFHCYNRVDQFDTLGLGANVPVVNGLNDDAMHLLVKGKWMTLRVPYPLGSFYTKGVNGRIDNPNAGWKGRSWHASTNMSLAWHQEGGYGTSGGTYQIQLRPNPLGIDALVADGGVLRKARRRAGDAPPPATFTPPSAAPRA